MSHPHLVQTYTYSLKTLGEGNDFARLDSEQQVELAIIMEYCDGGNLYDIINKRNGLRDGGFRSTVLLISPPD